MANSQDNQEPTSAVEPAKTHRDPTADHVSEAEANLLRAKLQAFLSRNPESDVGTGRRELSVCRLWGEDAIEIPIGSDEDELIEALNAVRLPPRFTAIWHDETKEFEVIFTVLRREHPLIDRTFDFLYNGTSYSCGFGSSSPTLMTIARHARHSGSPSRSDFRNLQLFYSFERWRRENPDGYNATQRIPTSFWIRGIEEYDDELVGDLVRNLNFYMSYFDRGTPTILVHEEHVVPLKPNEVNRSHAKSFPETISAQNIDQHLLILWASAEQGDVFLRFIHYYQILEYAGFYHIQNKIRSEVERAIAAPDAVSRPERVAQQLLDAVTKDTRGNVDKINAAIEDCVNTREIWDALSGSISRFSEEVELDGGFVLPAVVSTVASYEEFDENWNKLFVPALHQVRNALVHARESRQTKSIAPTIANHARLAPWLLPLSQTAARVMLYSKL